MNRLKTLLTIALTSAVLAGCTSQGRLTHAVFEREDASFRELDLSLEKLYEEVYDGNVDKQFKAVRSLRHLAKWSENPAKRQMAVRGLVFVAAYADDGDVADKANARLSALIESSDHALAAEIIRAKSELATGQFHLLLRDDDDEELILADEDEREEAVEFLVDHFDEVDGFLKYQTALAFADIMKAKPVCFKMGYKQTTREVFEEVPNPALDGLDPTAPRPEGVSDTITKKKIVTEEDKTQRVCREDDGEVQASWKYDLADDISGLLAYGNLEPEVQSALLMAASSIAYVEDPSEVADEMEGWEDEGYFTKDRLPLLSAAMNQAKGYYPDLYQGGVDLGAKPKDEVEQTDINADLPATAIAEQLKAKRKAAREAQNEQLAQARFNVQTNYSNPAAHLGVPFWLNNAKVILERQLFRPGRAKAQGPVGMDADGRQVPQEWLFFKGYDGSAAAKELQSVLYFYAIDALNSGYLIENPRSLGSQFKSRIDALAGAPAWEQERELALVAAAWPSLKAGGAALEPLAQALKEGAERNGDNRFLKNRYLLALTAALKAYADEEPKVCDALTMGDVAVQRAAFEQVKDYPAYVKPQDQNADSLLESPKFCGVELYTATLDKSSVMAPAEMPAEEAPAVETEEPAQTQPEATEPVEGDATEPSAPTEAEQTQAE